MSNNLNIYNEILFVNLRPWKNESVSDVKFRQDLKELMKVYYQVQPNFEVVFTKALNNKRKYYQTLIGHEAIQYLNDLHTNVTEGLTENAKKYHVQWALTRTLPQKLKEVNQVIEEREYTSEQFEPQHGSIKGNASTGDSAFATHYLKHQLVRLYMEVQEQYPDFLKEDPLTEEDIYLTYFSHQAPTPSCISEAVKIKVSSSKSKSKKDQPETGFKPIMDDVRDAAKGILSYSIMIKNTTRFASFEEQLFQKGYIDTNYCFTDKHGTKNELAAIYHQLIKKGYFSPREFDKQKDIKPIDVRKFLDHRYSTKLDKQFRTHSNDSDKLLEYIESQYWLTSLPVC